MMTTLDCILHKSATIIKFVANIIEKEYRPIECFVKGPNNQDACNHGSQYTNDLELLINTLFQCTLFQRLGYIHECVFLD